MAYYCNCLLIATVIIFDVARASLVNPIQKLQTLEECDQQGKSMCYTGEMSQNSAQIDKIIDGNDELRRIFTNELRPEYDRFLLQKRRKRDIEKEGPTTDCSGVCCSVVEDSDPYSHFKTHSGWQDIASTPKYPQRVAFAQEKCLNVRSPCRGVRSVDGEMVAQCMQVTRSHKIFLYNTASRNIESRYIRVDAGCKCKLDRRIPRL